MAGQLQANARWMLNAPLDSDWRRYAVCHSRLDLPWTPEEAPDAVSVLEMRTLCEGCPVRQACAVYGLTQPGGFYGGVWVPWAKDGAGPGDEGSQGSRLSARNSLRWVRDSATHGVDNTPTLEDFDARESRSDARFAERAAGDGAVAAKPSRRRASRPRSLASSGNVGPGSGPGSGGHNRRNSSLP